MALDRIVLEARVEEWGQKCAAYVKENGKENPHFLLEYGKALFATAKLNSSLVDSQKMEEKQLPLENPKVKVVNFEEFEDTPQDDGAADERQDESKHEPPQEEKLAQSGSTDEATVDSQAKSGPEDLPVEERGADGPDAGEIQTEQPVQSGAGASSEQERTDAEEQESSDAGDAGDEDDFEVAFQIVDLARVLFEKEAKSKENDTLLATTRELLGDISLEDDNAAQAVEDYTAAVELKRQLYGDGAGEVSEAEFMLSLAYDAAGNPSESLAHLKLAAAAAEAAKLPSAAELTQRAKDLEQDLAAAAELNGQDTEQAKAATQESISGRTAIASAVQSLVSRANDISGLARKRKRDEPASAAKR